MSINKVVITGNLTRDAEMRQTASGLAILNFSVAVNDRRRNSQTGNYEDVANYIDCVMFGNRAQNIAQYLLKGTKLGIEGKLRWSQWEDRETGKKRSKIEVVVDDLEFLSSRNDSNGGSSNRSYNNNYNNSGSYSNAAPVVDTSSSYYDEDIPF